MMRAIPSKSVPVIKGIGVRTRAMKRGFNSLAARTMSLMNLSSFPIIASICESPEINTRLSISYQRGSS